jgi:hypothetical protein
LGSVAAQFGIAPPKLLDIAQIAAASLPQAPVDAPQAGT